jgi:hypothetical protein
MRVTAHPCSAFCSVRATWFDGLGPVFKEGEPFLVRCTADAGRALITCEACKRIITPYVLTDTESASVREESGEWRPYPVQQYKGPRSPWTPKVGDIVGHGNTTHRWRIARIDGKQALLKLLANHKETGAPGGVASFGNSFLIRTALHAGLTRRVCRSFLSNRMHFLLN